MVNAWLASNEKLKKKRNHCSRRKTVLYIEFLGMFPGSAAPWQMI